MLAYVENPNPTAEVVNTRYSFKLYNAENVLIGEKTGVVTIGPKSVRPIIETGIETFKQVPTRVSFEFLSEFMVKRPASMIGTIAASSPQSIEGILFRIVLIEIIYGYHFQANDVLRERLRPGKYDIPHLFGRQAWHIRAGRTEHVVEHVICDHDHIYLAQVLQ